MSLVFKMNILGVSGGSIWGEGCGGKKDGEKRGGLPMKSLSGPWVGGGHWV